MEIFLNVLQGAYAYLLIFQILVVSLLFLVLCWLVIKRTKEAALMPPGPLPFNASERANPMLADTATAFQTLAAESAAGLGTPTAVPTATTAAFTADSVSANPSLTAQPTGAVTPTVQGQVPSAAFTSSELSRDLEQKLSQLELEKLQNKQVIEESKGLQDKVKFLESKLLEYEILQEEIGALSALKHENEQLKRKLVESGLPVPMSSAAREILAKDPAIDGPEVISPVETPAEPLAALPHAPAAEPSAVVPETQEVSGDASIENLEKLLDKIDELTKDGDPASPGRPSPLLDR